MGFFVQEHVDVARRSLPLSQGGRFGTFALFVKTRDGSAGAAAALIRERLREIDAAVPAYGFRQMNEWVDASSARTRIRTWMLALVAALALVLVQCPRNS